MKKFCVRYHRQFMLLAVLFAVVPVAMLVAGCGAPTWLTDANSIIGLVGSSVAAIGSFIAGLTGDAALAAALAVVATWVTKVQTGISDLDELISQYQSAPSPTLLTDIESALSDVQTNLAQDFSNLGLPTAVLSTIAAIAGLALTQIEAWGSLLPALSANAMQTVTIKVPYTKKEFQQLVDKILTTPTGDAEVDTALAKVKRL